MSELTTFKAFHFWAMITYMAFFSTFPTNNINIICICFIFIWFLSFLFWEYLFAFPLVSMLVYLAATIVAPYVYFSIDHYANAYYKYCSYAFPKLLTDVIYTRFAFHNPPVLAFLILLAQAVVPLLLTMLVFKFKKKEKKKKKGEIEEAVEEISAAADAIEEAVMIDPEIKDIMKETELTEDLPL